LVKESLLPRPLTNDERENMRQFLMEMLKVCWWKVKKGRGREGK
jgi:hypothetical protein